MAQVDGFLRDLSRDGGGHARVGEIEFGLLQDGFGVLDGGDGGFVGGFADGNLLFAGFSLEKTD